MNLFTELTLKQKLYIQGCTLNHILHPEYLFIYVKYLLHTGQSGGGSGACPGNTGSTVGIHTEWDSSPSQCMHIFTARGNVAQLGGSPLKYGEDLRNSTQILYLGSRDPGAVKQYYPQHHYTACALIRMPKAYRRTWCNDKLLMV